LRRGRVVRRILEKRDHAERKRFPKSYKKRGKKGLGIGGGGRSGGSHERAKKIY